MHMIQILPNLFTRGCLSEGATPEQLESLGIRHVVSLFPPGEPSLVGWDGYTHASMSDGKEVNVALLEQVVEGILLNLRRKRPTLVMCRAGRNRTGLVVSVVLSRWLKIPGEEALDLFRSKRPRAVANPAFERYLLGLTNEKATDPKRSVALG